MNRRDTLGAMAALALSPLASARIGVSEGNARLLAAWADHARPPAFFAGGVEKAAVIRLPTRPHGVTVHPQDRQIAYVCARRPGEYLWRIDLARGEVVAEAEADDAFRFEGHAIVDAERSLVYTSETELDEGRGRIGVYDAATLASRGSFASGGLGPHELAWLAPDRIAVAHGGILTLPETGRVKRNLDAMEPSLTILDTKRQVPIASHALPDRTMGIRHLAVGAGGVLGIALQNEGPVPRSIFAVFDGEALIVDEAQGSGGPDPGSGLGNDLGNDLGNYGASVAAAGEFFAVSCTRANLVAQFDRDARLVRTAPMRAPSGIAAADGGFVVSNELGEIVRFEAGTLRELSRTRHAGRRWDNHLVNARTGWSSRLPTR